MRLLVVEDYEPLRESLAAGLRGEGYAVDATGDGEEGWWYLSDGVYDAAILDAMLPGCDGIELIRRCREAGLATPILMLTARDTIEDRVAGLDAGADDYMIKPFAVPELLARLRRLLRRGMGQASDRLEYGDLCVDLRAKRVEYRGQLVQLTAREFQLLECLLANPGAVVSRQQLWEHCYDFAAETVSNVLEVLIARVRRKLAEAGCSNLIETRRGQGYQLVEQPA
ncbi:MAG: DNA-binding response regulator [Planctomycetota bacterium]|nr:MAG: DNA-binding response regulator [Planctomycetota bacterium]